jgi:hypothetical protein
LWAGLLVGPVVWLVQFQSIYTLVTWTCVRGQPWTLHVISVVSLLLTTGAALISWRSWRAAGGEWRDGGKGGSVVSRSRFMSALGLLVSAMFFLVVLAQWIASWILGPCQ